MEKENSEGKPLLILKASAGSGKTYSLVEEFLKIILKEKSNSYYKSVLALTFTNKAATEMKERIIEALVSLSEDPKKEGFDHQFFNEKVSVLGIGPDKLREKSRDCLNEIIHNYGNLSVLTIDKFSHKIVRSFARDLELESDFGIELDSKELKREVISELVDSFGRDPKLSNILYQYSKSNIEEGSVWNITKSLFEFSHSIENEKFEQEVESLKAISDEDFDVIQKNLQEKISIAQNKYKVIINELLTFLETLSTDHSDYFYKAKGLYGNVLRKAKLHLANGDKILDNSNLRKGYEKEDFSNKEGTNTAGIIANFGRIKELIDIHDDFIEQEYPKYSTLAGIRKKIYNIRLINTIQKTVDKLKSDKNIKEIADLNKEISKIILSESIPFIYERIGERYKHFLLDEFQDTSITQWQNLIPLVENGISEGKKSLIVGDAKQSIYRFRNGEVEQFMALPDIYNPKNSEIIEAKRKYFKNSGFTKTLENNFRSKKEIVEFNNFFFEEFAKSIPEEYKSIYLEGMKQNPIKGEGGFVQLEVRKDFEEEEKIEKTISTIKSCLSNGFEEKDICLILRYKKDGLLLAEELEKAGISVISDESLYVKEDLTVQFIIHVLKLIVDPDSYESQSIFAEKYLELKEKGSSDVKGLTFYQHYELNEKGRKSFRFKLEEFLADNQLPQFDNFRNFDSLVELVYLIRFHFQLNYEENPYLELFFEQVYKYEIKKSAFLKGFIDWWEDKGGNESIMIPDSTNAVKMMTVHKSKGLQFPVVILPFCEWGFGDIGSRGGGDSIWVTRETGVLNTFVIDARNPDKEKDEELKRVLIHEKNQMILDETNNLYVAFTRAINRLYVFSEIKLTDKGTRKKDTCISTPISMVLEDEEIYSVGVESVFEGSRKVTNDEVALRTDLDINQNVSFSFKPIFPNENIQYHIEYGVHLHGVLSEITIKKEIEKLPVLVDKLKVSKEEKEKIIEDVKLIFEDKNISSLLFEDVIECISEQDIISETGSLLRPDRVLLKSDKIVVIDFKTGKPRSKDKKQVRDYVTVLNQMGSKNVEGCLVYTKEKDIVLC